MPVTDADRQAADKVYDIVFPADGRDGLTDETIETLFAAHREAAERAGAQAERASIVAWLRDTRWLNPTAAHASAFADAVERNEHHQP